jgi:hypothetical protein
MAAPLRGYRALCQRPPEPGRRTLLRRPALVAVVIGGVVTLTTTGTLAPGLFLWSTLTWAVAPALQALLAAALMAPGPVRRHRRLPFTSAMDLFFAGHGPWSLWLLALGLAVMLKLPLGLVGLTARGPLLLAALVPLLWTAVLVFAFCRTVLGLGVRGAVAWTAAYQIALWALVFLYVGAATYRLPPFRAVGS